MLMSRFTTEANLFHEMDYVAGTSGAQEYSRKAIVAFLRSKNWVIEESAEPICIIYMRGIFLHCRIALYIAYQLFYNNLIINV